MKYVTNKTYLPETLLMHLAHEMQVAHKDSRVQAWDFPTQQFVPEEAIEDGIDWQHVVNVVMGREQLYGPDNPRPNLRKATTICIRRRNGSGEEGYLRQWWPLPGSAKPITTRCTPT